MALLEVPEISFDGWSKWSSRPRPSQDFEVPHEFGILGLYVIAAAKAKPENGMPPNSQNLPDEVVYIGMSTHVDRRLEKAHRAVNRYLADEGTGLDDLWFSTWRSEWTNFHLKEPRGIIALATLAVYERALILAYARKYGRLPLLNRV